MSLFPFYRSFSSFSSKFVETKIHPIPTSNLPPPARFAYLISGSAGDGKMLKRTLQALYHPDNQYVVHLDRESSAEERLDLSNFVKDHPVFLRFCNAGIGIGLLTLVHLIIHLLHRMICCTHFHICQGILILLIIQVTLDGKSFKGRSPVIIDPGLYMTKKADVFWITQRRSVPTAFKLFTDVIRAILIVELRLPHVIFVISILVTMNAIV
ncbi:hypothetical protein OIU84_029010, partial [Salix udensis]